MIKWHVCNYDAKKDGWIGLPKRAGSYLVTVKNGRNRFVEIADLSPKSMRLREHDVWETFWYDSVIAWTELPKPYGGR